MAKSLRNRLFRWWNEKEAIQKSEQTDIIIREAQIVTTDAQTIVASYRIDRSRSNLVH